MNLTLNNISKSYNKKEVLKDFSFNFSEGNCYCILGTNGAGKSTLMNLILQLIPFNSGKIYYDGLCYNRALPISFKQRIGFLSEDLKLIDELSLYQYLILVGKLYKIEKKLLELRIADLYNLLFEDSTDLRNVSMSSYSTGMKKKAAFIASIIHLPDLLILDEPFANLDPIAAQKITNIINSYKKESRTIILSSHNLEYIEKVNPTILLLSNKSLIYNGLLDDFTSNGKERIDEALFKSLSITSQDNYIQWI